MVWIEMPDNEYEKIHTASPPSRWCGLKCKDNVGFRSRLDVTTFAVVWIEMTSRWPSWMTRRVTTFAVVWIEILPARYAAAARKVTTFAVVWIEIFDICYGYFRDVRHHLRGGVD